MSGRPVNFSRYILEYMSKVSSTQRPAPLHYANLLTLIFRHFGVCLTHEVCETRLVPTITPQSLNHFHFFKTESRHWKFIDDMTPAEKASLPESTSSTPITSTPMPSSSTMNPFYILDERLYDVQELIEKLEYILVQRNDMLDGIAHNQAIMDNHLRDIRHLLTSRAAKP